MDNNFQDCFDKCKESFEKYIEQKKAYIVFQEANNRAQKIMNALLMAYSTAQRTFDKISEKKFDCKKKEEVFSGLGKKIESYFNEVDTGKKEYSWECFGCKLHEWRTSLINAFQDQFEYSVTVGQAQKIINMTFKFLYCLFQGEQDYDKYFQYCHMPLDSYTLAWFRKILLDEGVRNNYKNQESCFTWGKQGCATFTVKTQKSIIKFDHNTSWSSIENDELYRVIQNIIHNYLGNSPSHFLYDKIPLDGNSLKSEFIIWPYMKVERTINEIVEAIDVLDIDFSVINQDVFQKKSKSLLKNRDKLEKRLKKIIDLIKETP